MIIVIIHNINPFQSNTLPMVTADCHFGSEIIREKSLHISCSGNFYCMVYVKHEGRGQPKVAANPRGALTYESDVPVPTGFQKQGAIGDKFVVKQGVIWCRRCLGAFGAHSAKNWTILCWNAQIFVQNACQARRNFKFWLKFLLKLQNLKFKF